MKHKKELEPGPRKTGPCAGKAEWNIRKARKKEEMLKGGSLLASLRNAMPWRNTLAKWYGNGVDLGSGGGGGEGELRRFLCPWLMAP